MNQKRTGNPVAVAIVIVVAKFSPASLAPAIMSPSAGKAEADRERGGGVSQIWRIFSAAGPLRTPRPPSSP